MRQEVCLVFLKTLLYTYLRNYRLRFTLKGAFAMSIYDYQA
ncbi:glutathione peroxidase, partial [Escherichia coli]